MFTIFILIIAVVSAFVAAASRKPDNFCVSRSAVLPASPDQVFVHINDLSKWNAWSPWAKMDPNATTIFSGPAAGVGAKMRWASQTNKVGVGSMTITESMPNELVRLQLEFEKPMKATNQGEFTFKAEDNQTRVTWSTSGTSTLVAKIFSLLFNCEKMIGAQFEKGLDNLRLVVQGKN